jgi:hypothetical protein
MPRRPASITQADVARIIRAAKQAGAAEVAIPVRNGPPVIVRLTSSTGPDDLLETKREIVV